MAALGSRLLSGEEKIRDEKKGREWLKKAIAAKEYSAYLALGDYEENVKKDLKAALAEYERGKDAGQIDCILRTADFYIEGKGVEKDDARGLALLEKAAEAGSPVASFRLAVQSLSGEKPDLLVGYKYLARRRQRQPRRSPERARPALSLRQTRRSPMAPPASPG